MTNKQLAVLKCFLEKYLASLKDLEPEYAQLVSDHFWELI